MDILFIEKSIGKIVSSNRISESNFSKIQTDSRKISPRDIFLALKGDHFDGHAFIDEVIAKGASCIISEKPVLQKNVSFFQVPSTLTAYRNLGKAWRKQFSIPVFAIGGSVGKTTTKDLLAAALRGKFKNVLKTTGSQNGFVGLPMTLLQIQKEHDIAVIEIGIDAENAMSDHVDVVYPTIAALTAISEEHLEFLHDLKTVAREELVLLEKTAANGHDVFVNVDDPWIKPFSKKSLKFSLKDKNADYFGTVKDNQLVVNREPYEMILPGDHNAANQLCATAICLHLGMTADEIRKGFETFENSGGRSQVMKTKSGVTVLCDYYNANPASMRAAFATVVKMVNNGKLWLCLADMHELGDQEEAYHRELANDLPQGATVLLRGDKMKWLFDELKKKNRSDIFYFESHDQLSDHLASHAKPIDTLLIKGSRGQKMEKVWEHVKLI